MEGKKLIYLVDDDEDDIFLMKEALTAVMEDIAIMELHDGQKLLESLAQNQPQQPALILMDMNMPRVNGLEALHLLKSNPKTQPIPVIMVSTSASQEHIRQAYQQGISAYVTKPASMDDYMLLAQTVHACYLNNYYVLDSVNVPIKFKDKSILVIEDDADQWELMSHIFKVRMPEVAITRIGDRKSTLDYLTNHWNRMSPSPQLIILDLYLPSRRNGLNLLDSIRYFFIIHRLQPVPVIVFSYSESQEDIKLSYSHRANAYMIKTRDLNESFSHLETVCHFWWHTVCLPKRN
jgi:CheY-like chemotaxis protein